MESMSKNTHFLDLFQVIVFFYPLLNHNEITISVNTFGSIFSSMFACGVASHKSSRHSIHSVVKVPRVPHFTQGWFPFQTDHFTFKHDAPDLMGGRNIWKEVQLCIIYFKKSTPTQPFWSDSFHPVSHPVIQAQGVWSSLVPFIYRQIS